MYAIDRQSDFKADFGADFDISPESPAGSFIASQSERDDLLWQLPFSVKQKKSILFTNRK